MNDVEVRLLQFSDSVSGSLKRHFFFDVLIK
jgi:hypothetical protein